MDVEAAIRGRRTVKRFNGAPVERETLEALLELAIWAPNHRLTEPWRFYVVAGDGLPCLADVVDEAYRALEKPGDEVASTRLARKRVLMRERIESVGALIYVTIVADPKPAVDRENYAATCCAIQNLMLAATGRGLSTYWSTGRALRAFPVLTHLGIPDTQTFCGAVFCGYSDEHPTSHRRPATERTRWIG